MLRERHMNGGCTLGDMLCGLEREIDCEGLDVLAGGWIRGDVCVRWLEVACAMNRLRGAVFTQKNASESR